MYLALTGGPEKRYKVLDKIDPSHINVRPATHYDIPALTKLGEGFYASSNMEEDGYDPEWTAGVIYGGIIGNNAHIHTVVVTVYGVTVGGLVFEINRLFTKYLVAHQLLLYVDPEFTNINGGKLLLNYAEQYAKERGAKYFYGAYATGKDDDGKSERGFKALFKRLGYLDNGFFMRKEL